VLDKVTDDRRKAFRMDLRSMLYMGVLMSKYRREIIAKSPPDAAVRILGFIGKLLKMNY
jgi:hypothetical protein